MMLMMCRYGLWLVTPTCWHMMRSCGKRNSLQMWRSCWAIRVTHWPAALSATTMPLMAFGTKPGWCRTAFPIMLQCRCTTTGRRKPGNGFYHQTILLSYRGNASHSHYVYTPVSVVTQALLTRKNNRTRRRLYLPVNRFASHSENYIFNV